MTEIIDATKLSRFGLSGDGLNCLIEFERKGGRTDRLTFPSTQLDEAIGLLLQLRQVHAERSEGGQTRTVLLADRVGVSFQKETETVILDFVISGAPISFAIPRNVASQLVKVLGEWLPADTA